MSQCLHNSIGWHLSGSRYELLTNDNLDMDRKLTQLHERGGPIVSFYSSATFSILDKIFRQYVMNREQLSITNALRLLIN